MKIRVNLYMSNSKESVLTHHLLVNQVLGAIQAVTGRVSEHPGLTSNTVLETFQPQIAKFICLQLYVASASTWLVYKMHRLHRSKENGKVSSKNYEIFNCSR